jgi:hypothetical protein
MYNAVPNPHKDCVEPMFADVAALSTPVCPCVPVPANVVTMFKLLTARILYALKSETYKIPSESPHTVQTRLNEAEVAGPPSPLLLADPDPANVVIWVIEWTEVISQRNDTQKIEIIGTRTLLGVL